MSKVSTFPSADPAKPVQPVPDQKALKETISEYLRVFGFDKTLSASEIQQFTQTALAGNLDPFKREIYIAVYGEGASRKVSILTGYQVYLKRAERTGSLDGWRAWIEGEGAHMKAVVEIFRKDWSHSFTHEVYWEEAVQKKKDGQPTQFWAKQPRFQLRKVAMAQAFRLAFPDELGGLPYESAEPKIGESRKRGAGNTSIDLMMAYETAAHEKVILLVEMKYSESYGVSYKRFRSDGTDRFGNYEDFFYDLDSPIDRSVAPDLEDFLYEPFYQLMRHTFMASQMRQVEAGKISRVQVVHLVVSKNRELLSVTSPRFRSLGDTTYEVWRKLLKHPEGFTVIPVESFFSGVPLARYRELEPWELYMKSRYSFLR